MTSTQAPKKLTFRRLATFIAAIGVLVMSSGVALMVSAGPASAATKVGICHATSSDSHPYTFISVDDDSVKYQAHLAHKNTPNKTWNNAGTFEGVPHAAGAPKPDIIGVDVTAATCDDISAPLEAVADVDFTDPTCANENLADYDTSGANVTFEVTDGSKTPGVEIEVTATANDGSLFADQSTKQVFTHTFGPALNLEGAPCVIVEPPVVDPPDEEPPVVDPPVVDPPAATPTVVHSGLITTPDLRGEQGLALLVTGMVLLVLAGGLSLVRPTR